MNSSAYLKSYGWKEGEALKRGALRRPILVKHKKDTKGLGHTTDHQEAWWERVFDGTLKGLDVTSDKTDGVSFKKNEVKISGVSRAVSPLYRMFVSGGLLEGTIKEEKIKENKQTKPKKKKQEKQSKNRVEKKKNIVGETIKEGVDTSISSKESQKKSKKRKRKNEETRTNDKPEKLQLENENIQRKEKKRKIKEKIKSKKSDEIEHMRNKDQSNTLKKKKNKKTKTWNFERRVCNG